MRHPIGRLCPDRLWVSKKVPGGGRYPHRHALTSEEPAGFRKRDGVRDFGTAAGVQGELRAVGSSVAVENIQTLEQLRGGSLATRSFATQLLIGFAVIASVLTLVGVYSVLSLSVAARRRELAIRSAVGAGRKTVVGLVLGQGMRLILSGTAAGVGVALVLSSVLQALLFEVRPADPITLLGAVSIFIVIALIACWAPAHRAAMVSPVEALRAD